MHTLYYIKQDGMCVFAYNKEHEIIEWIGQDKYAALTFSSMAEAEVAIREMLTFAPRSKFEILKLN